MGLSRCFLNVEAQSERQGERFEMPFVHRSYADNLVSGGRPIA
jgi:hypothetical protein